MARDKKVKKILFFTLSNIGDVILTLTSLDYLKDRFKDAEFTVLSGPAASSIFANDPRVRENISYNKHSPFGKKFSLFTKLEKESFDVIIDLRDTVFRWLAPARYKNPYIIRIPKKIKHLRLRHLYKTTAAFGDKRNPNDIEIPRSDIYINENTQKSIEATLSNYHLSLKSEFIVIAPGARSRTKRWHQKGFIKVCQDLLRHHSLVFIGDKNDARITKDINSGLDGRVIDLAGRITLLEAIALIKNAKLVIGNDSAVSHIASYLNKSVLTLFGPTDELRSGPYSDNCAVVRKNTVCSPCLGDDCKKGWQCMRKLTPQIVLDTANALLEGKKPAPQLPYRRVLVTRTDRLGDVLLSTPVIKNLRDQMPSAYIAMMVQESVADVIRGNPYIDEVITLDKRGRHKGLFGFLKFAKKIKRKKFDLALILHPTVRVHILLFLVQVKERIGYDIKYGFLNTRKLKHTKQLGEKHESDYALDFLRELGFSDYDTTLFMPLYRNSEEWAKELLKERNPNRHKVITIHMQASCPSKRWPKDYFNRLVVDITKKYNPFIIYIGSELDDTIKEEGSVLNLTGKTTISQLASILKRSDLFISNDSGPVHMAVALDAPVISIFGRKQPGLSPKRWGPLGEKGVFLHKDIGCKVCLAHDCNRNFACLKAIEPPEALSHVDTFLSKR